MVDLINIKERLSGDLPLYISNKLIESHFSLPLGEQRLLYAYISKISEEHLEFPDIELSVSELVEMLDIDINYAVVRDRCRNLLKRFVEIETEEDWIGYQWFSLVHYKKKEGKLKLRINDELKPYLLRLKKEFTRLVTKQVMQFRSVYSIRIYMLCKQYQSIGKRKLELKELRKKLGIDLGQYIKYNDFKKRILEHAQKEINELSDIEIEFEEIKQVRKVTEILFFINVNDKNKIRQDGVHTMHLKSMAEIAEMLTKETRKRWGQEIYLDILQKYNKNTLIELLCAIISGGYDSKQIQNVNTYFDSGLKSIESELRGYSCRC